MKNCADFRSIKKKGLGNCFSFSSTKVGSIPRDLGFLGSVMSSVITKISSSVSLELELLSFLGVSRKLRKASWVTKLPSCGIQREKHDLTS